MIPYSVTFGGISGKYASWKEATFAVIPFPVDMTTTYMAGTRNGPRAILDASSHMELFDEENKIEPYRSGIFVSTEIPVTTTGPIAALKEVERRVKAISKAGKIPVLLGGEHSGTTAAVAAPCAIAAASLGESVLALAAAARRSALNAGAPSRLDPSTALVRSEDDDEGSPSSARRECSSDSSG